jgi:hypothetical protein
VAEPIDSKIQTKAARPSIVSYGDCFDLPMRARTTNITTGFGEVEIEPPSDSFIRKSRTKSPKNTANKPASFFNFIKD